MKALPLSLLLGSLLLAPSAWADGAQGKSLHRAEHPRAEAQHRREPQHRRDRRDDRRAHDRRHEHRRDHDRRWREHDRRDRHRGHGDHHHHKHCKHRPRASVHHYYHPLPRFSEHQARHLALLELGLQVHRMHLEHGRWILFGRSPRHGHLQVFIDAMNGHLVGYHPWHY